ncbi:MAG TPA: TlpA disulfide reductase family protein [Patescibacteria group bacterium]|jgi:thiol-disulfide isomerase/thioredoxin|nr:TlpA disulfide reductase family protein [Patescibacteria group bacterium]
MRTQLRNSAAQIFGVGFARIVIKKFLSGTLKVSLLLWLTLASAAWAGSIKSGDAFPDLAGFKLEGELPDSMKGKVVLVDFWASWCEPCKQSFPVMQELHKRYANRGLVIIAVNVDENRPDMEAFLKKNEVSFTIVRDSGQKLVDKAGIATMPSSFLIDREGKVRFTHTGFRGSETKKKYEEEIESLLK